MIRMGGADAFMLSYETPHSYMHTFKVAILDPTTDPDGWSYAKFYQDFEDRLHLVTIRHCANSCPQSMPTNWIVAGPCG